MKKVLLVAWSQSGQLTRIAERIVAPLRNGDVTVDHWALRPQTPYPFPWSLRSFFDVFPESVLMEGPALADPPPLAEDYDLVILAYQVWYLAPSLPVSGFLQDPRAQRLLAGKPVIAVCACRNMWMNAWSQLRARLEGLGARVLDHVVMVDAGSTLATFITTPRWLLTGRRDAAWGLPAAGVAESEIAAASRFGVALSEALARDAERDTAPLLAGLGAVKVEPRLAFSERAGGRIFRVWARLIRAAGRAGQRRRLPLLALFATYLVMIILLLVPLNLGLQTLFSGALRGYFARIRARFEAPSGSGTERLNH